jgi:hypothetical protein
VPALCLAIAAVAGSSQRTSPGEAQNATPAASQADNAWLAKAAKLYFSTKAAGLEGFDCDVHPDWPAIFNSVSKGVPVADNDARVLALKPVRIAVHARLGGGSTVDWVLPTAQDKPLDSDTSAMMEQVQKGIEQIVLGFLQFWTPFVDGSVIPASSEGVTVTRSPGQYMLHNHQNGTELTEVFSSEMMLRHFNVMMGGTSIQFAPYYEQTDKGLLVNRFDALIQAAQSSAPAQEMHVKVDYAQIDGLPIPSRLNIEVVGTGTFNMALDGCQAIRVSK